MEGFYLFISILFKFYWKMKGIKKKWKIKLTKRVDQNNTDMISVNERIGCSYDTSVRAINVLAAL